MNRTPSALDAPAIKIPAKIVEQPTSQRDEQCRMEEKEENLDDVL